MNLSENELESILRSAPAPAPSPGLAEDILRRVASPEASPLDSRDGCVRPPATPRGLLRRWWPIVLPGLATAAVATALLVQHNEIDQLKTELATLEANLGQPTTPAEDAVLAVPAAEGRLGLTERQDLERLRALVASLAKDVSALESLQKDAEGLQAAIRAMQDKLPKELQVGATVHSRALSIQCVNHLKQLGLAVRVWATDHADDFPPDIPSMAAELTTPSLLVCPADESRQPAGDFASYSAANCSYEFLSPGPGKFETEPLRVLFRCPIHGHVGLCDGSVQQVPKDSADRFETRNGVLYMKATLAPPTGAAGSAGADAGGSATLPPRVAGETTVTGPDGTPHGMDPVLARRYGLAVPPAGTVVPRDGTGGAVAPVTNQVEEPQPQRP